MVIAQNNLVVQILCTRTFVLKVLSVLAGSPAFNLTIHHHLLLSSDQHFNTVSYLYRNNVFNNVLANEQNLRYEEVYLKDHRRH